jgi:hypothetical protein
MFSSIAICNRFLAGITVIRFTLSGVWMEFPGRFLKLNTENMRLELGVNQAYDRRLQL